MSRRWEQVWCQMVYRGVGWGGGAYSMYTFHSRHFTVANPSDHMSGDQLIELVYTLAVAPDGSSVYNRVMSCL